MVTISGITDTQIKMIAKSLKGKSDIRFTSGDNLNRQFKRFELILSTYDTFKGMDGKVRLEAVFQRARKFGYRMNRRTFQRDIMFLELNGKIRREVIKGGKYGMTTFLSKPNLCPNHPPDRHTMEMARDKHRKALPASLEDTSKED